MWCIFFTFSFSLLFSHLFQTVLTIIFFLRQVIDFRGGNLFLRKFNFFTLREDDFLCECIPRKPLYRMGKINFYIKNRWFFCVAICETFLPSYRLLRRKLLNFLSTSCFINSFNKHQLLRQASTHSTSINYFGKHQLLQQASTTSTSINSFNKHQLFQ